MSRTFRYYADISPTEDDVRLYLELDDDDEITDDMYKNAAYLMFMNDDCEYFDYEV